MRTIFKFSRSEEDGSLQLYIDGDFDCSWRKEIPDIPKEHMWLVYDLMQRAYDKGYDDKTANIRKALGI